MMEDEMKNNGGGREEVVENKIKIVTEGRQLWRFIKNHKKLCREKSAWLCPLLTSTSACRKTEEPSIDCQVMSIDLFVLFCSGKLELASVFSFPPLNSDVVVYAHVCPESYCNKFMCESKQMKT